MVCIFNLKQRAFLDDIFKHRIFGKVITYIYVIEFQKRGLPHSHNLFILDVANKPRNIMDYDKVVCAEIPDSILYPKLHETIAKCMMHGPCNHFNKNVKCMMDGKCTKKYPRSFNASTIVDHYGYLVYMRRDNGKIVLRKRES